MEKKITRRDLLKALIAGSGGIVAAGFVPEKWLKPVVKSGVLPVHAQASAPTPTPIPDLFIRGGYYRTEDNNENIGIMAYAFVSYKDIPVFSLPGSISGAQFLPVFPYPVIESPAKDANVILTVNGVKEEPTKQSDETGLVEWFIEYQFVNGINQSKFIDPGESAELVFKLDNGKTSTVIVEPLPR